MNAAEDAVIIVSGLPRSGTSLAMQMLARGGVRIFADSGRPPDEWNLAGYYEHELVKSLAVNAAWLTDARGAALKVVSPLLRYLPKACAYRVLFVLRDLDETAASQRRMFQALSGSWDHTPSVSTTDLASHLVAVRDWLARNERFAVLWVHHRALITNPLGQSRLIQEFLGVPLDVAAMALAIRPELIHMHSARQRR